LDAVKEIAGLALELANVQNAAMAEYGFEDERIDKVLSRVQRILKVAEKEAVQEAASQPAVVEHHGQADGASTSSESKAVTVIPAAVVEDDATALSHHPAVVDLADRKCGGCGQPGSDGDPLFSDGRNGYTHDSCIFAAVDGAVYAD
jgi:hypothetical protein